MQKLAHLFPNGQVERAPSRQGKIGYRWVPAYSEATKDGESIPMTRREWYAMARRDGFRTKFHKTKDQAKKALASYGVL